MRVKTNVMITKGIRGFQKLAKNYYALYLHGGYVGIADNLKAAKWHIRGNQ